MLVEHHKNPLSQLETYQQRQLRPRVQIMNLGQDTCIAELEQQHFGEYLPEIILHL